MYYRPPRRDVVHEGSQRHDGRPPPHRKGGERGPRERASHHERTPGESENSGAVDDRSRTGSKPEGDHKPITERTREIRPSASDGASSEEHRTEHEHRAAPRDRPQREDENWQQNRVERHPPERGRGGPRRGGEKDHHGTRGPPPTSSDKQERGSKDRERGDRERGGKTGPNRGERKTSAHELGDEKSSERGGRRPVASSRDSTTENRPGRGRGPPLLPNPPTPLLVAVGEVTEQHPDHEMKGRHQPPLLPPPKKPAHDRDVKGHPGLGYGEVIDIESSEDWDNEPDANSRHRKASAEQHTHTEGDREHGHRRGGEGPRGKPTRSNRDDSRTHQSQRNRDDRPPREDRRGRDDGRRDGRRGGGGKGGARGDDIAPRHTGQRKPHQQPQSERKSEESESELPCAVLKKFTVTYMCVPVHV